MKKNALLTGLFCALFSAVISAQASPQTNPPVSPLTSPLTSPLINQASAETAAASAAEASAEPIAEVDVSATKNPDWKPYRVMLKGLTAFEQQHALAPQASAKFVLKPRNATAALSGVALRLASDAHSLPIALADNGTFTLPRDAQAEQDNAELMINRKKELFRWWPYVRSPQLAAHQRRLGDLRLECQMFWAIHYDDLPFMARNFVRALGGPCKSSKVMLSFPADFTNLRSATLIQGERRLAIMMEKPEKSTKPVASFSPPLFDASFSDDAIIELEYEAAADASKINYQGLNVTVSF
ncbi:hypothetical protein [Undibacterium sp.]|uniref:hypothetical protein n=1 Tax=Undibacterium sp. TaxID=1914977 RepID=UPI0025E85831|nr:hypothetical protein [Undibacterium sp.]